MSFSSDWLALREPFDKAARNADVLRAVVNSVKDLPSVRIVDLACGTGSTLRSVAPLIDAPQSWRLIDNDLGLLARASGTEKPPRVSVQAMPLDLNRDLEAVLDGPVDLVTTSALLDLVSAQWLERLATEIAARGIPFYAALSYDGRALLDPPDALDGKIVDGMNRHQRTDKGFGPALGPDAAGETIGRFKALGYAVTSGESDWRMGPADREIQSEIMTGWAYAAREIDAVTLPESVDWLTRRRAAIAAGTSSLRVGHVDVFAAPARR